NTGLMIPKLKTWFHQDTPMLDFGYIASEVNATDLLDPATDGSLLQVQNAFYEFVPVEENDLSDKTFLMAHQLEVGRKYFIYVTTFSGLYRYDMNDVIEVVGHFNQVPIIIFLYKGKGITNLQGEKLTEAQFIEALDKACQATGIDYEFFFAFADVDISGYKLYIEFKDDQPPERVAELGRKVDEMLCAVNVEYDGKFKTDRLKPIAMIDVGRRAFERYREIRLAEGAHEGQLKWLNLSSTDADKVRLAKLAGDAE
ncbi:MAG: GH3 auxin-responsive promoter family protein, partial [Deltaproteobacteria bacterium]|nr:GH3 auxin-responsive promoter family protein [Deltaproteobacteria bacterium]